MKIIELCLITLQCQIAVLLCYHSFHTRVQQTQYGLYGMRAEEVSQSQL